MRKELPLPFEMTAEKCGELYVPNYQQIAMDARSWGKAHGVKPAALDKFRVAALMIDNQVGFCMKKYAPLYVGGAEQSSARCGSCILRNLDLFTTVIATFDTHTAWQIFMESMIVDENGNHPDATISPQIKAQMVKDGKWRVDPAAAYAIFGDTRKYKALQDHLEYYCGQLENPQAGSARYELTTWPYHTMLGGVDHALVPALMEVCMYHSIARGAQTVFEIKGGNPLTENYSVFCPEVTTTVGGTPIAQRNTKILERLLSHDAVLVFGQAKSHCVAWSIDDLLNFILKLDPKLASKVYLVEDCTDPVVIPGVVDFTAQANAAFDRFRNAGMHVVKSTTPFEDYLPLAV